ncbi:division/cell wall cluster transcriptional repressor MraZ [Granulicella arctica]|uniref:division/cell wall cluster transcriptional repressor MraZ n=1 Tax=Granulicella arctica TaxID=940613 RepID=UPI0021DFB24D|nr:division/cell wall cluster transcriptional repressor MraZ [Granulicella arctica]
MFRGNHPTRVDEKGRLKLPAAFKHRVDEFYKANDFFITSKDGKRAELWPLQEWEKIEAKVALIPQMNPLRKRFLELTSYWGQMAEMDGQGRLLIHPRLRESARTIGEVEVVGMQVYLDVVNSEGFKSELAPMSEAEQMALSEFGL